MLNLLNKWRLYQIYFVPLYAFSGRNNGTCALRLYNDSILLRIKALLDDTMQKQQ